MLKNVSFIIDTRFVALKDLPRFIMAAPPKHISGNQTISGRRMVSVLIRVMVVCSFFPLRIKFCAYLTLLTCVPRSFST